jgi:hypothetical protein
MKFEETNKFVDWRNLAGEVRETKCQKANSYFVDFMSSKMGFREWLKDQPGDAVQWAADHGYVEIVPEHDWSKLKFRDFTDGSRSIMLNNLYLIHFDVDGTVKIRPNASGSGSGYYNEKGQLIIRYDY